MFDDYYLYSINSVELSELIETDKWNL